MSNKKPKTRLYYPNELKQKLIFHVAANQGHYLVNVLRIKVGEMITIFNGSQGEWDAEVIKVGKGKADIQVIKQTTEQIKDPDIWYVFAPIKTKRIDYMMQKATELGVTRICPVMTKRTNLDRIKPEKIKANIVEAAEQCGRMTVPQYDEMTNLDDLLKNWPDDRALIFCDEARDALPINKISKKSEKWAMLFGPEGGFTSEERDLIRSHKNAIPVTLGPRILRADTAAVAGLSLWQTFMGDWKQNE